MCNVWRGSLLPLLSHRGNSCMSVELHDCLLSDSYITLFFSVKYSQDNSKSCYNEITFWSVLFHCFYMHFPSAHYIHQFVSSFMFYAVNSLNRDCLLCLFNIWKNTDLVYDCSPRCHQNVYEINNPYILRLTAYY